jgi:sulfite exporter TauE/SafE
MPTALILSAVLVGLAGGLHCVGMCGGLLLAAGLTGPTGGPASIRRLRAAGYHLGRITTYALLGALAGSLGSLAWLADHLLPVQQGMHLLALVMMVLLGLWLLGLPSPLLVRLERGGAHLWRAIAPLARRALGERGFGHACRAGLAWGLLPCALVYSVLSLAMLAGSAWGGALVMAAFGLATLPHLLTMGWLAQQADPARGRERRRRWSGVALLALALASLDHGGQVSASLEGLASWCRTQAAGISISP